MKGLVKISTTILQDHERSSHRTCRTFLHHLERSIFTIYFNSPIDVFQIITDGNQWLNMVNPFFLSGRLLFAGYHDYTMNVWDTLKVGQLINFPVWNFHTCWLVLTVCKVTLILLQMIQDLVDGRKCTYVDSLLVDMTVLLLEQ